MLRNLTALLIGMAAQILPGQAFAAFQDDLRGIAQQWASARYESSGDERKLKLGEVIKSADEFALKYPDRADSHLWAGVVRCSLAEIESKLTALGLVKECRAKLEQALAIDPAAEDGYAYGVLGTLYAKVPGWPLAFGDKKKADELLLKGVTVAPNGMNSNYFYAKFLYDQGDVEHAQQYIERAATASPPYPPEESLPVTIRQREIHELSEKIKASAP
jgi:tetratricopeptide (TPR) repeat protein